jgi:flavodoxin
MEEIMKRIGIIVFSPTGTTEQNCMAIAEAIPDSRAEILNITYPGGRQVFLAEPASLVDPYDRIIVGAPVYAGKIPAFAREILEQIPGKGRPATVVAVYGNRDYGIAVKTLADILSASGFVVDSAGAFIGEHSYSEAIPVAVGRPDELDLQKAREFGSRLGSVHQALSPDQIPVQQDMFTRMKGRNGHLPSAPSRTMRRMRHLCGELSDGNYQRFRGIYLQAGDQNLPRMPELRGLLPA